MNWHPQEPRGIYFHQGTASCREKVQVGPPHVAQCGYQIYILINDLSILGGSSTQVNSKSPLRGLDPVYTQRKTCSYFGSRALSAIEDCDDAQTPMTTQALSTLVFFLAVCAVPTAATSWRGHQAVFNEDEEEFRQGVSGYTCSQATGQHRRMPGYWINKGSMCWEPWFPVLKSSLRGAEIT